MKNPSRSGVRRAIRLSAALACAAAGSGQAQVFLQEDHVRMYSKAQLDAVASVHKTLFNLPLFIDASLSFEKRGTGDQVRVLWTSPWGIDWYRDGKISSKDFFKTRDFEAEHDELSTLPSQWLPPDERTGGGRWTLNRNYTGPATADVDGFIQSIYKLGSGEYLGFVHIERSDRNMSDGSKPPIDRLYAIGIAYSNDDGKTWTYAGDVIRPKHDALGDTWAQNGIRYYSNIGGVPFTVVRDAGTDYFYVYFNEHILTAANPTKPSSQPFTAVARAKVSSVVADAKAGRIQTAWKKYNPKPAGNWVEEGLSGQGAAVLPHLLDDPNAGFFDMHSRAAYSPSLGKHLLLANEVEWVASQLWRRLVLFTSTDGLSWNRKQVIDASYGDQAPDFKPGYNLMYGSMVSFSSGSTADFNKVGKDFTVIYPRQLQGDYTNSDLYSRKIVTTPDISPSQAVNLLF